MEVCKVCMSDNLEKMSSTGLRVVICIVLIFIPFGFLICWLPFVFEHKYICKNCGTESKSSQLLKLDWREKEKFLEEYRELKDLMKPFINMWIIDYNETLYKIVLYKEQLFAIEFNRDKYKSYRIKGFKDDEIKLDSNVGNKLKFYNTYSQENRIISEFGKNVFKDIENNILSLDDYNKILDKLKENNLLKDDKVEVIKTEEVSNSV